MTRDDIVQMAHLAGLVMPNGGATENQWRGLEIFATLISGLEREACAKVCDVFAVSAFDDEAGIALNIQKSIRARGQV